MARAETIKNVRDNRGGGCGPLPGHDTCHMKSPWSFRTWPGLLTHTISTGNGNNTGTYLHHCHHRLHRPQALYLPYVLRNHHPGGLREPQTLQHFAVLSASPSFNQREDCGEAETVTTTSPVGESAPLLLSAVSLGHAQTCPLLSGSSEEQSAAFPSAGGHMSTSQPSACNKPSGTGDHQDALRQQGPPLDLLPQIGHLSWYSRQLRGEQDQELQVRRVATQLRTIADKFNSTVLHEVHAAPNWQDWTDVYQGLLSFITQTLNAFWRIT